MKRITLGAVILLIVASGFVHLSRRNISPTISQPEAKQSLVSLGDSVAAGQGLATESDSSACNRTNESYPNVLASSLNMTLDNIACSGATISSGVLGSQTVNSAQITPQINQLFDKNQPNLITITIGANDIGWSQLLAKCYTSQCGSSTDTKEVDANIVSLDSQLRLMLSRIQEYYRETKPKVIITGYYQVFPLEQQSCLELSGITSNEVSWSEQQRNKLNNVIRKVAEEYSLSKYANVDFSNHELCTTEPWVQGFQNKTPFHPNETGQAYIAKSVESSYK